MVLVGRSPGEFFEVVGADGILLAHNANCRNAVDRLDRTVGRGGIVLTLFPIRWEPTRDGCTCEMREMCRPFHGLTSHGFMLIPATRARENPGSQRRTALQRARPETISAFCALAKIDGDCSTRGETTVFVYDASGKVVAEYSTIVASVNDAKVAYMANDHLGSLRINTDANGAITARSREAKLCNTRGQQFNMSRLVGSSGCLYARMVAKILSLK